MSKIKDIEKLKTQQHKLPSINRAKYGRRSGLEGPFMTKSGKVVYYDKSKGRYLDPTTDMYLSYDDWKALGESRIMGLNRTSAEYKAGKEAAKKGLKYDANPYTGKEPGFKRLNWSTGHNDFRADALRKAGKPNYGARGQFEEAPANATGPAVAGTGDDSSTVVVKKKKPLQDKLMKRMGIKEAIDRAVPDLEYEVDEITRRTNQLKEMALKEKTVPKDKDTDQPKKYVSGLSDKDKKAHDRHLEKGSKKSDSDKSAYKQSPADKIAKTKPSVHTKKYKQMFGEDSVKKVTDGEFAGRYMVKYIWNRRKETGIFDTKADAIKHAQLIRKTKGAKLDEAIEGLKNKAEKSGMPYGILKKVYDRGMAAYKTGHRPGTTAQQWAFARVNSFVTKSKGTWGGADKDLAAKVRG